MNTIIRWGLVALAIAGTAAYVYAGLTGRGPLPWVNGWMAAPMAALTVLPIAFKLTSGPSRSAFRGGALGIGTLVQMHRTGLTVNDQPQMDIVFDVETADGRRFRGTARQIVDIAELGMLVPGTALPVRYLPDSQDGRVMIAADADPDEVQSLIQQIQLSKGALTQQQVRIAREGLDATAVVMEMRPTGEVRQGDAVIDLLLRVTRPDRTSYDTRVRKALPAAAIPGVQPGMVLHAKYLPENEQDVSIEVRFA